MYGKNGYCFVCESLSEEISGGMKQRAALARALAMESKLILMDEPFSALDEVGREVMDEAMQRFFSENRISAVLVTHSLREALLLGDRVVLMHGRPGRILEVVTPQTPKEQRNASLEIEHLYETILGRLKEAKAL